MAWIINSNFISDKFKPSKRGDWKLVYGVVHERSLVYDSRKLNIQRVALEYGEKAGIAYQTKVRFESSNLIERLIIFEGKIVDTETHVPVSFPSYDEFDWEVFSERLQNYLTPPKISPATYHNIKSFEEHLKKLPDFFQNDLEAVYIGNGIYNLDS
jgi:hypothetical protein